MVLAETVASDAEFFPPRFNNNNNYILGYMTKINKEIFRSHFKTQY